MTDEDGNQGNISKHFFPETMQRKIMSHENLEFQMSIHVSTYPPATLAFCVMERESFMMWNNQSQKYFINKCHTLKCQDFRKMFQQIQMFCGFTFPIEIILCR
ncbi:CLUMA_CG013791, isoform A [Clunio marinus]|uniref:CLUMA_CG013791, isoform A n=1 Tax=Clunio marinus TaxID=568069 RepID=A0A1J1IL93_9DIPT|nr:CLUMA_CG013791, isoform A [Clunio marinus]